MIRGRPVSTSILLLFASLVVWQAGKSFRKQHEADTLFPSTALSRVIRLSDFNSILRDTPGDTDVYIFEGKQPGGSLLIIGGTHATEIAGFMTAVLLVETLDVEAGRIFVIPRANASAATHTQPGEAHPRFVSIDTKGTTRRFRYGARYTNPLHQQPDPELFRHPASPQIRTGREARNLNRVYPGIQDGTLTERVAWAIVELIRREQIDLAFDLHEAPPDRKLVNAIVAPEVSQELASEAVILLQLAGWDFHLEGSSRDFRGLSHREWADFTDTKPFLMETANPVQGKLRGRTSSRLALLGIDDQYAAATRSGVVGITFDENGIPIERRIARNLAALAIILDTHNAAEPRRAIVTAGWPDPAALTNKGLGYFLAVPRDTISGN